jgi:hypothetical protein
MIALFLLGRVPSIRRACLRWVLALGLLASTAVGMRMHADRMADLREQGLPLAAELPPLERRLNLLTAEVQLSEVQKELRSGSQEERLRVFVFPDSLQRERVIGYLDAIHNVLEQRALSRGAMRTSIGKAEDMPGSDLERVPVQSTFTVASDGVEKLVTSIRLSGLLTVADALPQGAMQDLLRPLEATHPADIVALEQFLSTDLAAYAQQPRVYEDRLLNTVGADSFRDVFHTVYKSSLLPEAEAFLQGDQGRSLAQKGLWPSPFLLLKKISAVPTGDGAFQEVTVEMETFIRKK